MNTIFALFTISLSLALLVTPLVARLAGKLGIVDMPSGRKVHTSPIPRIGGVAIYFAFFAPFACTLIYSNALIGRMLSEQSLIWILMGATIVFLMGLTDDIFHLRPGVKLFAQAAAALLAYMGGVRVVEFQLPWASFSLGVLSLPITIFWFLLVINAINLIDGLDGLAAGISLFVALVLLISSLLGGGFPVAMGLAALAGACLGFLRYNYNPASIFMGDSGSYFLGYMLAALSILGSIKSQATVAILIPMIALGLPLMDAVLSPIRRFLVGKQLFQPDKNHIHHRLLRMGLSHRNAVLALYGATICLGLFALMLVHFQDQRAGIILLITGISMCIALHRLGYFEFLAIDTVRGYFRDITDAVGLHKNNRTFLCHQISIDETLDTEQLWEELIDTLKLLKINQAEISFDPMCCKIGEDGHYRWCDTEFETGEENSRRRLMSIDLPLGDGEKNYGTLQLRKDVECDPISHCTLRRIEQLRRSLVRKLRTFELKTAATGQMPGIECRQIQASR